MQNFGENDATRTSYKCTRLQKGRALHITHITPVKQQNLQGVQNTTRKVLPYELSYELIDNSNTSCMAILLENTLIKIVSNRISMHKVNNGCPAPVRALNLTHLSKRITGTQPRKLDLGIQCCGTKIRHSAPTLSFDASSLLRQKMHCVCLRLTQQNWDGGNKLAAPSKITCVT